jgi:hypothetical protein
VLGPLPPLYRFVVTLTALAVCMGAGAWVTIALPGTLLASTGAGIGAGIGMVVVLLLLHDFSHRGTLHARRVDARTRRRR